MFLQFLMILVVIYQYIETNIITVRPLEPQFQVGGGVGPWDSLRRADFLFMAGLAAAWGQPYFGHRFTWIMTINLPWNHYHQDQYIYIYDNINIYIYILYICIYIEDPHWTSSFPPPISPCQDSATQAARPLGLDAAGWAVWGREINNRFIMVRRVKDLEPVVRGAQTRK